jgi:hypothetical protein
MAKMEAEAGIRLPPDLRRLLLEIGDVGQAIFSVPLLHVRAVCKGDWLWTSGGSITLTDDVDDVFPGGV